MQTFATPDQCDRGVGREAIKLFREVEGDLSKLPTSAPKEVRRLVVRWVAEQWVRDHK
jgi:hypothetical protein